MFAVDLGSAVDVAYRNTHDLDTVHVIQGDIAHLPLRRCANLAFSVGVLHHMVEPAAGFQALVNKITPGGRIAVWVYGREGNEWIVSYVDSIRSRITSRLPPRLLYELCRPLAFLIATLSKGIYRPLSQRSFRSLHQQLPCRDYLTYISGLPARVVHNIVFDQLVTPIAHYIDRAEVESWLSDSRLSEPLIKPHNANSWRAHARVIQ